MRLARHFRAATTAGRFAQLAAVLAVTACASGPPPKPGASPSDPPELAETAEAGGAGAPSDTTVPADSGSAGCLIAREELSGQPAVIEGRLGAVAGGRGPAPLVLRLTRPRCVVGLPHTRFVTDVWIASAGADLRPLVDTQVRLSGDVIAGTTDSGEAAVVLLVHDVARAEPGSLRSPHSLDDP